MDVIIIEFAKKSIALATAQILLLELKIITLVGRNFLAAT
jgi:hypothetical protein